MAAMGNAAESQPECTPPPSEVEEPVKDAEEPVKDAEAAAVEKRQPGPSGLWLDRGKRALPYLLAVLISASFALTFGFNYGVNNQVAYLLSGLQMADPTILQADWYASEATHYHPAFGYLSGLLLMIDPSGWSVAIALFIVITACMTLVYWTAEEVAGRRLALPAYCLLMLFVFLTKTRSVGVSYIVDYILQPSTFGSLGLLAALPLYLRGRWMASGIALGLGGLFHANFLMLGFPLFGLAHLLQGRDKLIQRGLMQLGPSLLAFLLLAPIILESASSPHGAAAQQIYFHVRSPHHYLPSTYERAFTPFVGWQLLGIALGGRLLRGPRLTNRRLGTWLTSLLAVLWIGTVLTTATFIPKVAQVFVWRLAPFADLICQLLACITVVRFLVEPRSARRLPLSSWALLTVGLGFLLMFYGNRHSEGMLKLLMWLTVATTAVLLTSEGLRLLGDRIWLKGPRRLWQHAAIWLIGIISLGAVIGRAQPAFENVEKKSGLIRGLHPSQQELFSWMKRNTPKDAQFLTPPDIETIRYHGQRAIVVDWKSTPILPGELVEWRQRLADVTGRPKFRGRRDLNGYNTLTQRRLDTLKKKYSLDYVLVRRGREKGLAGRRVFSNRHFVLLQLDEASQS